MNSLFNLLHGRLPGKGFLGRSSTGSGPGELLSGADAIGLLPAATASADGKMTTEQVVELDAAAVAPVSNSADFVPQWDGANTGVLKEGLEVVDQWITAAPTPTGTGLKGQRFYSSGYMYECVATNTWIRTAVETTW